MYGVSEAYKTAIAAAIIKSDIECDIDGTVYTSANILAGSFSITNQCTNTKDLTLGSVYIGQLSATFIIPETSIGRTSWVGRTITPTYKLWTGSAWESLPLGVFTVSEATWTTTGVRVVAYDAMEKLDKICGITQTSGTIYDFLATAAEETGVTLGNTQAEIEAMPNGSLNLSYMEANDVSTWRDLVSYAAQILCGFATINRAGELEIRQFGGTAVDTIGTGRREYTAAFSDYETHYTGVAYTDIDKQAEIYHGAEVDDGTPIVLGSNPFLQIGQNIETASANILAKIGEYEFTPFKATVAGNPAFDLGDALTFTGGRAGTSATGCVMRFSFNNHRRFEMQGYGSNPKLAAAQSKYDKNLSGLLAHTNANEMAFYELRNVRPITIGETEKRVLRLKLATKNTTRVQIHININLEAISGEESDLTICQATYYINSEIATLHPEETYIDGNHILHLMYIMPMQAQTIAYFALALKAGNGTIEIERQGLWLFASGLGLVGDGVWDGTFDLWDETEKWLVAEVTFKEETETLQVSTQTPIIIALTDTATEYNITEPTFADAGEWIWFGGHLSSRTWGEVYNDVWATVYQDYIWGTPQD